MANLTIVVNDQVLQRARIRAIQHGTSVNAVLRDYLEAFAGGDEAGVALAGFLDLAGMVQVADQGPRRWTREELYDRSVMRDG